MTESVPDFLQSVGLHPAWEARLNSLGVSSVQDLSMLTFDDLGTIGMPESERNKLMDACAPPPPLPSSVMPVEVPAAAGKKAGRWGRAGKGGAAEYESGRGADLAPDPDARVSARAATAAWAHSAEPMTASPSRGESLRNAASVAAPSHQDMSQHEQHGWPHSGSDAATRAVFKAIKPVAGHLGIGDRVGASALKQHLRKEAAALLALTDVERAGQKESMSREDIGRSLLAPGETYLSILSYKSVEIFDDEAGGEKVGGMFSRHKAPTPRRLEPGEVVLTNKRLIFISSNRGDLERAKHEPIKYCGPLSWAAYTASCCCAWWILCKPLDEWKPSKDRPEHSGDGVFLDHSKPGPPSQNGSCCECCVCCYPCMPCFSVRDLVLTSRLSEQTLVLPLPLSTVRSVEADALTCVKATADIKSHDGICTEILPCLFPRSWAAYPAREFEDDSERMLTLGALMPPWGKRTHISVHVKGTTPEANIWDFVQAMQNGAKALVQGPAEAAKPAEAAAGQGHHA